MDNRVQLIDIDYNQVFSEGFDVEKVAASDLEPLAKLFGEHAFEGKFGHIYGASASGHVLFNSLPTKESMAGFIDLSANKHSLCDKDVVHPKDAEWGDYLIIGVSPSNYMSVLNTIRPLVPSSTTLIFPWKSEFFDPVGWMKNPPASSASSYDRSVAVKHARTGPGDPRGKLLFDGTTVTRVLMEQEFDFYDKLLGDEEAMRGLNENGLIPVSKEPGFGPDHPYISHPTLPPQWAKHWTFSQHRDATLFFLDFWDYLVDQGFSIQDSHSGNVMFWQARPVFVDFCSIGPIEATTTSPAFINDFFKSWITPLAVLKAGELQLFREVVEIKPGWDTIREKLPELLNDEMVTLRKDVDACIAACDMKAFLSTIRNWVENVEVQHDESGLDRVGYQPGDVLSPVLDNAKDEILVNTVEKFKPATYLDMGCNKGRHSCLAAVRGASVVSLDMANSLLDKLYITARDNELPIDPFFVNASQVARFNNPPRKFDMISCFALMHHLVFSSGMKVADLCEQLSSMCKKVLILEFIEPVKIETYIHKHYDKEKHADYTLANVESLLQKEFNSIEKFRTSPTRIVLVANK